MENIEKEIKLEIKDFNRLFNTLLANGAKVLNKSKERTIRFDKPSKELEKNGVFLRVRAGAKNTMTLKEKIEEGSLVRTRKEIESEIEDIDKMTYILKRLGFSYVRIMEKYRINLSYKNTKLSIDELPFGMYLEIEGTEKQIEKVSNELGFNFGERILGTYWDLFEKYKDKTGEKGRDIVFSSNYASRIISGH